MRTGSSSSTGAGWSKWASTASWSQTRPGSTESCTTSSFARNAGFPSDTPRQSAKAVRPPVSRVMPDSLPTPPGQANIPEAARRVLFGLTILAVTSVSFSVFLSSVAMGSAILIWLWLLVTAKWDAFPRTELDLLFLLYLAAELLATAFSGDPLASFVNTKRFFLISFVYLILLGTAGRRGVAVAGGGSGCAAAPL